ncbi:DNA polymerase III subunit alpha [Spiroplasma syrphidicola EA-1]|uniref:DNA-directed DNA polymerase n=1 Tax=Spiroplasma syrphidicola EA-1 TaxID=1276229 RepID=R4UMC4_9MOLU|nr:DNA polymerase III subunit alpha [Spiroplasma syrphidicola]AGM26386.1 DNA polymerase III subunit alpha [Spiroplasma syrphidicola EA-1]
MLITHLNVRTSYSLLSSLITLENYLSFAKKNNLKNLAICDNNMFGVYEFHTLCQKNNIKPIVGLNVNLIYNNQSYNLNLFAVNQKGYFNLVEISSTIMANNEKINKIELVDILQYFTTGLKIIVNYTSDNYDQQLFTFLQSKLENPNNLYLGLNNNNLSLLETFQKIIPSDQIIWNNKIQYFTSDNFAAFKMIDAIKTQTLFKDNRLTDNYAWTDVIKDYALYFENITKFIADIEQYSLAKGTVIDNLLQFPTPENISAREYLKALCKKGLEFKKGKMVAQKYLDRLFYELEVINKMGFNDYFLIVWDYVAFAKKNNIYVGPGRGSAAGSLVSYLLDITTIDPLEYNLLFERFLNPERNGLPDIDIDFQDDKREMVVEYLFEKYGVDHVAHIVTFQTIGMKMALRDLSRIFEIPLDEADKMSKAVKIEANFDYDLAMQSNNVLSFFQKKYPQLFLYLKELVGLPRQTGTHAAGVILTNQRLQTIIPIKEGYNGIFQTQYSMNYLEDLGLLKMDLLGLRNLTILHNIIDEVGTGLQQKLAIEKIPLNDEKTFALLAKGDTKGIFQLESPGMTKVLIEMQPDKLEDIVATSSLYRPGPQENIPLFIQRKKKQAPITYLDQRLGDILAPTYGIIVYQEQVMLIAQLVANFSLAKADVLRRAMGKKDATIMNEMQTEFMQEAVKNNYTLTIAQEIWNLIAKFAAYGFNRSHAVAYSLLGYQMAYLKANYPSQFLASLLSNVIGDEVKTTDYLALARQNNLKIVAPAINFPADRYRTVGANIHLPLLVIKQIGYAFFNKILVEFNTNGPFKDIYDLFIRLYKKGLNRKTYEMLVFSGALDCFKLSRTTMFNNYQTIVNYLELIKVEEQRESLIVDQTLAEQPTLVNVPDDEVFIIEKEYECLGFYLSNHPLKYIREKEGYQNKTTLIKNVTLAQGTTNLLITIRRIRVISDKNNKQMAFLDCYDESGEISLTAFAGTYQDHHEALQEGNILLVNIRLGTYQDKINGIINRIKLIGKQGE